MHNLLLVSDLGLLVPILGVVMSLAIPMVIIYYVAQMHINNKNRDKEVRQLIIENNVDFERAKLLIAKSRQDNKKTYTMLRIGCFLIGAGFGALLNYLLGLSVESLYFYLVLAFGCGLGMMAEFIVEWNLQKKEEEKES
jgi:hypothetical protein